MEKIEFENMVKVEIDRLEEQKRELIELKERLNGRNASKANMYDFLIRLSDIRLSHIEPYRYMPEFIRISLASTIETEEYKNTQEYKNEAKIMWQMSDHPHFYDIEFYQNHMNNYSSDGVKRVMAEIKSRSIDLSDKRYNSYIASEIKDYYGEKYFRFRYFDGWLKDYYADETGTFKKHTDYIADSDNKRIKSIIRINNGEVFYLYCYYMAKLYKNKGEYYNITIEDLPKKEFDIMKDIELIIGDIDIFSYQISSAYQRGIFKIDSPIRFLEVIKNRIKEVYVPELMHRVITEAQIQANIKENELRNIAPFDNLQDVRVKKQ